MGRRRRQRRGGNAVFNPFSWIQSIELSAETKQGIFTICLFVIGVICLLGLFDLSGSFGQLVAHGLALAFGAMRWLFPLLLIAVGYFLLRRDLYQVKVINYIGAITLLVGACGLWHVRYAPEIAAGAARDGLGGGYLGYMVTTTLGGFFGLWGTIVIMLALVLIGLLLTFETSLYGLMWPLRLASFIGAIGHKAWMTIQTYFAERRTTEIEPTEEEDVATEEVDEPDNQSEEDEPEFRATEVADEVPPMPAAPALAVAPPKKFGKKIELPLELLTSRSGKPTSGDIKSNQEVIKRTLANFGIPVEMSGVNIGPTVTQYTLRPAEGIRLSKVTNLNSDLALSLAAHPLRIEAPIPGKSLVGIEIPNQIAAKVTMFDLLSSKEFKDRSNNLMIALGKDVSGLPYFAQLDRMPHLLIAGATGSGKSVCVNSIIMSLLFQNSPDELKFILVDPKRVELPAYNNIPYLLTPVITDVKKTIGALKWAVTEMERRFEVLSKAGKRNIEGYNQGTKDVMPYIVIVIDELADLMATSSNDIEAGIVRLAQMARAVGIHLILATQRPSVEVITGLIKANIPARIAFSVASAIDSRTILDGPGAEKLVGRGDMLYLGPETSRPKRIQGVYLSDKEIHDVIGYIKDQGEATYIEALETNAQTGALGGVSDDADPLLGEAKDVIRQSGKASASLLQRRLKVGYARAARLLDLMEAQGVIGPADGAKAREIFLDRLGGVGAVQFAAREHDLEGELNIPREPAYAEDLNEPEPVVVFKAAEAPRDPNELDELPSEAEVTEAAEAFFDSKPIAEATPEEVVDDVETVDEDEVEEAITEDEGDESEDEAEDEEEVVDDESEVETEPEPKPKSKQSTTSRKAFDDDEWT